MTHRKPTTALTIEGVKANLSFDIISTPIHISVVLSKHVKLIIQFFFSSALLHVLLLNISNACFVHYDMMNYCSLLIVGIVLLMERRA